MNIELEKLKNHDVRCIVVTKESLTNPASDYKTISFKGAKFKILTFIKFIKGEKIPELLKYIAVGESFLDETLWKQSEKVYFFIVKKI